VEEAKERLRRDLAQAKQEYDECLKEQAETDKQNAKEIDEQADQLAKAARSIERKASGRNPTALRQQAATLRKQAQDFDGQATQLLKAGYTKQAIAGWTKGFAAGAGQTPRGTLFLVVVWMIGLMFAPLGWVMTGDWLRWGAMYLLCVAQVAWFGRLVGGFRWITALLYPLPLIFFLVFAWSAARSGKPVSWEGREIRTD
jgi:hypothetical protein